MGAHLQYAMSSEPTDSVPTGKRSIEFLRRMGDESGSITIETAVSFMIMMTMILGIMEFCMMGYTYAVLEESAREGVRYAIIHGVDSSACAGPSSGCDATAANVVLDVKNYAESFAGNVSAMTVNVTYPDGTSTGTSRVQVAISYTYQPIFHFPGIAHVLSISSSGRILY
jgi:Flp pilus assembly protein TadG